MGCCPVVPPCTLVSLTGCRRKSLPWPPAPRRSRSLPPLRGSTPSGSVAPSWLPCPPSSRCGSASRSTMRQAPALSTGSASKYAFLHPLSHHLQRRAIILVSKPTAILGDSYTEDDPCCGTATTRDCLSMDFLPALLTYAFIKSAY